MKRPLLHLVSILFFLLAGSVLYGQSAQPEYKELILGFNDDSFEKKIQAAASNIRALPGILWTAPCGNHQLLFVVYDPKIILDPKQIFDQLDQLQMKYEIKQDATISQVRQDLCPLIKDLNSGN